MLMNSVYHKAVKFATQKKRRTPFQGEPLFLNALILAFRFVFSGAEP